MDMEFELESPPSPPPMEPPTIRRLDDSVVNRIAAGEVIQRPVSAVKELVENSLDAHSTSINVVIKDGGLKLIQVSDDGHGIRYEDLPILCERHTTSKLSTYEDLQTIKSMGFRGEALASMTHVAHVTVTTITEGQLHGYRVSYKDGVMEHEPKACAAVKGTQIMVENLFYNMTARKKTLQNTSDDYLKIVDVISRFAIHHTSVSFICRKHGAGRADVHSSATSLRLDSIRSVYGASVSCNLMKIESSDNDPAGSIFSMDGFISNSNYIAKKTTMVLFINDRLVECTALKRALEIVYAATLPKASKPFIYMSIKLPPEHVDVNVHPTKREVSLLNQEIIIERIQFLAESKLRSSNTTRVFAEQTCLQVCKKTVEASQLSPFSASKDSDMDSPLTASKSQKVPVNKMVRTDARDPAGRLDAYLQAKPHEGSEVNPSLTAVRSAVRQRRNPRETADLTSIQELIDGTKHNCDSGLLDIVRHCTFVGMADNVLALLQHGTHMYLANVVNLSKDMMYQQVLKRFAHFNAIQLSDPAPIKDLIVLALQEEDVDAESNGNDDLKQKIAELNSELLKKKTEMLDEYFGISINSEGYLLRIPVILDQYTPDMDRVPDFLLTLGNDVEWENEKNCFQGIAAAIANFYAMHPPLLPNPSGDGIDFYKRKTTNNSQGSVVGEDVQMEETDAIDNDLLSEAENAWAQREWSIQHVLFPSMRLFLEPPSSMATDGTFVKVASLERLYRVFERC
ncbi:DNA mismatch repair protein MLH1 [Linum grandiflorum]